MHIEDITHAPTYDELMALISWTSKSPFSKGEWGGGMEKLRILRREIFIASKVLSENASLIAYCSQSNFSADEYTCVSIYIYELPPCSDISPFITIHYASPFDFAIFGRYTQTMRRRYIYETNEMFTVFVRGGRGLQRRDNGEGKL